MGKMEMVHSPPPPQPPTCYFPMLCFEGKEEHSFLFLPKSKHSDRLDQKMRKMKVDRTIFLIVILASWVFCIKRIMLKP